MNRSGKNTRGQFYSTELCDPTLVRKERHLKNNRTSATPLKRLLSNTLVVQDYEMVNNIFFLFLFVFVLKLSIKPLLLWNNYKVTNGRGKHVISKANIKSALKDTITTTEICNY